MSRISIFGQNLPINLQYYILVFSVLLELLPIVFYLVNRKKIADDKLRVIFLILLVGFVHDVYGVYSIMNERENILIYNFFMLLETLALFTFFFKAFSTSVAKTIVAISGGLFIAFWIGLAVKFGHNRYYNNFLTFQNIFLILFILYYFFEKILVKTTVSIATKPEFWVVIAYLVFTSGTFILMLYYPTLGLNERAESYILNYLSAIFKTILLTVAMFMKNKPEQQKNFQLT